MENKKITFKGVFNMENKNLKQALGLGISGLMAVSSLNLAVFAGVDNENDLDLDNVEKGISEMKIEIDDQSDNERLDLEEQEIKEDLDIDLAAEDNKVEKIPNYNADISNNGELNKKRLCVELGEEKNERIKRVKLDNEEAEKANDLKRKNLFQMKMKIEDRAARKRAILHKMQMLNSGVKINEETFPDKNFRRYIIDKLNKNRLDELWSKCIEEKLKENIEKNENGIKVVDENGKEKEIVQRFKNDSSKVSKRVFGIFNFNELVKEAMSEDKDMDMGEAKKKIIKDYGLYEEPKPGVKRIVDGTNAKVTSSELKKIESIYVDNKNVKDLTGVEKFENLGVLSCENNQLKTLNVSGLEKLRRIEAKGNKDLRQIDAKGCKALVDENIDCDEGCEISWN